MCNDAVEIDPFTLRYVSDHLKMQEMCIKVAKVVLWLIWKVPDHFKTQEMRIKAVWVGPSFLELIPDHFKTQEICDNTVRDELRTLLFVPDWFVRQQQIYLCYNDSEYCDDDDKDNFFKWDNAYKIERLKKPQ